MTLTRYIKIAKATWGYFESFSKNILSIDEQKYLATHQPAARNLQRRIVNALAHTLLAPDQISQLEGMQMEDPTSEENTGPQTETPLTPAKKKPTPYSEKGPKS